MSVSFREMVPDDADVVAAVEAACFPVPWSRESCGREASNEHTCYRLAVADEQVVGFAGCWVTCDEAQITNIALLPDWRGQGLGTRLMADLMAAAKARGCTAMTLEVRPSNTAALALYHHYGFKEAGRRKGYYTDNGEDAIIMWLTRL